MQKRSVWTAWELEIQEAPNSSAPVELNIRQ
jgi:hypothetical protein